MTVNLLADGNSGVCAIWTGDDDLPFSEPTSHLGRVKFHSSLAYPKVVDTRDFTVNFPARATFNGTLWVSATGTFTVSYSLFAHGRAGTPWVLASALVAGVDVAMTGSVPVQKSFNSVSGVPGPWARWITIGADATNVYLYEYTVIQRNATTGATTNQRLDAINIPIRVWVTDELL